jgi:hypothetical protein
MEGTPSNNEMKRTRSAIAQMARPSPLISVLDGSSAA